ncbi:MAG: PEP/pyruvate-binding domain-containing protein [Bacteroidales bacterium]|nr:PEP/pyruvate-binding domain-containing protein [Bacteroidales bacterium]
MSRLPNLREIVLRDTPFARLMTKRIYNVLLIATRYDAFTLEDDGRVDELIFNEYTSLSLRYPPRFTRVTDEEAALAELENHNYELVIVMPNMAGRDIFAAAASIKERYPALPIVVLTPFSREVRERIAKADLTAIDYVFAWLGNPELLLAIIKLIEDKWNADDDLAEVGVQSILLVEDSVRFYSSALPHLYRIVLEQSREFSKEALNEHLKTLRMRGRPKIMLARSYEEAMQVLDCYGDNLLGIVSDMSFMRNGEKDALAGYALAKMAKERDAHLPFILESSEAGNAAYAERLGVPFIHKNSKTYPQDLRQIIMDQFGFGDFIIRDPHTGKEILRITNLKDLQQNLYNIPDEALRNHLSHNHFSRFFYSRAMFPPAELLKRVDVSEYAEMDEARRFIFDIIVEYRRIKNSGVVAEYRKDRFDAYSNFARIGNGSLGGKGRGLAFMGTLVAGHPRLDDDRICVNIPRTVVICTDIFDEFMERNGLYPIALSDSSDAEILAAFERGVLPEALLDDLLALFDVVDRPIAVRSSGVLEDAHYQPFAGVYATYMVPRVSDKQAMLALLRSAIKAVYASVFFKDSKAYMTATQNLIDQEKMAIVLQEVVGSEHGQYFYPTLSGVARSLNFYPIGEEKPADGVAKVALGLGAYIVDGGKSLRFCPAYPHNILQLSELRTVLREGQKEFFALDLSMLQQSPETDTEYNIRHLPVAAADDPETLRYAFSTLSLEDQRLTPGGAGAGRRVVTFSNILEYDAFPLARVISDLLRIGSRGMGRPVELEYAMDIREGKAYFYLLQIRPIVDVSEETELTPDDLSRPALISSTSVLGNGMVEDVHYILYVLSDRFDALRSRDIAAEIGNLNEQLTARGESYVLVGPGRWGSSDPALGIPVKWSHISGAKAVVECGIEDFRVDASEGTHFFQNLTSFGVGYFTIRPFQGDGTFDESGLNALPAEYESHSLRLVKFPTPLFIKMDGRHSRGIIRANN